jgi:hypothetical protein
MIETNRIKTLAGLIADNNDVAKEDYELKATDTVVSEEECGCDEHVKHEDCTPDCCDKAPADTTAEAVGQFADPIHDLCDELGCEAEHPVYSDLIRYLDGDTIKDFVDEYRRVHDFGNGVENPEEAVEVQAEAPVAEQELEEEPNEGNEFSGELAKAKAAGKKEFKVGDKTYKVESEETDEEAETIEEAPTMDTTQLITLLKNSGIDKETINKKIDEWANTPEGVGEIEPRVHGGDDNYEFAQAVNLSLKKYLKAKDMGVSIKEGHTVEDMKSQYKAKKESQK